MSDCVFCGVVAGTEPAHRVHRTEQTLAFLDAAPAAPGHALVVPTSHHETLTAMPAELAGELFETVQRVTAAVESALDPEGASIVQSNGTAAGQDVFHAHVHVIPRFEDDGVTVSWSPGELTNDAEDTAAVISKRL